MKYLMTLGFSLLILLGLQQCAMDADKENAASESGQSQNTIVIYGSDECSHCVDFKKKLDSAGYAYTFHDVEKEQHLADEMLLKVQNSGFQGYIRFPVVEVDGVVKVNPSFEELQQDM